ncbi:MAG: glycerophosphodiester phosphodiesterase [Rhodospirillales bacterium]|nr:MAG: glycerophosphodiester phosphodiesterase [Rhodospirillales bacterium]
MKRPISTRRTWTRSTAAFAALLAALSPAVAGAQGFDLQGHRGARGLAPENTLAAFRLALEIGVTTLETDLAVTADDVLVLSHDPALNPDLTRDSGGKWLTSTGPAIRGLTLAQVKSYDVGRLNPEGRYARQWPEQKAVDGERIPALSELVALTRSAGKPAMRFNIETKLTPDMPAGVAPDPATFARMTIAAFRREGIAGRAVVQSFDWRTLLETKKQAPDIETSCLTIESTNMDTVRRAGGGASPWHAGLKLADHGGSLPRLVKAAGCSVWSVFWRNLTPELVKEAQALGLKVIPWTVNDRAEMDRLIAMGVDGVITDYPDRLRAAMAARGMKLP